MLINNSNKDYCYYLDIIQELVPVDVTILLCLLLLIVTSIIYLVHKRMSITNYRTFRKLKNLNETSSVMCYMAKIRYNPEMYCITVNKQFLSVVKSMCRTSSLASWSADRQQVLGTASRSAVTTLIVVLERLADASNNKR